MARPHGSKNKPKSQPQILFANNPSLKDSIDIMGLPPKNSPSLSSDADDHLKPKKQRGRPKGSKSKPKSHPQIFSASNPSLKDSIDVIDVPSGAGIISWLCWYSYSRQKNITVLSAFGLVSQLSILPLLTNYPHIISVPVLSLSGSIPLEITSSPSFHSLTICVPGCEGQIVYGVIGGSVVATSIVTIVIVATECESDKDEDNKSNSGNKIEFNNNMMEGNEHEVDNNKLNAITNSTMSEVEDYVVRPDFALEPGSSLGDYVYNL